MEDKPITHSKKFIDRPKLNDSKINHINIDISICSKETLKERTVQNHSLKTITNVFIRLSNVKRDKRLLYVGCINVVVRHSRLGMTLEQIHGLRRVVKNNCTNWECRWVTPYTSMVESKGLLLWYRIVRIPPLS